MSRRAIYLPGTVALVLLFPALSSCTSEFANAMHDGCQALRDAARAYEDRDREEFEPLIYNAMSLGGAVELSDAEGKDQQDHAGTAYIGARALYTAAYEGIETNNGKEVWAGSPLGPDRQEQLQAGLAACDDY